LQKLTRAPEHIAKALDKLKINFKIGLKLSRVYNLLLEQHGQEVALKLSQELLGKAINEGYNLGALDRVENRGDHAGRVRLQELSDASAISLRGFIRRNVAIGSQVRTGDWQGHEGLGALGYDHQPRVQGKPIRGTKILPWAHRVVANLKNWLRRTHHKLRMGRLQGYLNESFTFRFNRRNYREHAFLSLLILATRLKPLSAAPKKLCASSA